MQDCIGEILANSLRGRVVQRTRWQALGLADAAFAEAAVRSHRRRRELAGERGAPVACDEMFKDALRQIVEQTEGAIAGLLMGFDGIAVDSYTSDKRPPGREPRTSTRSAWSSA